jgi:RNA polymerase sigma factor (sigma-70 family)
VTSRIHQDGDRGAKARLSMERGAKARLSMESQEAFFTLYWPRLVRFLFTQASNSSLADDVAGDTFLKAWDNWDTLLRCERPDSWLFKVAIRQLRREEAHARSRGSLAEDPIALMADIQQAAVMDEWVADNLTLSAAIRTLPRRQAEVIACALVSYTTRETAKILGMSEGTVRSHLCIAQGKLRVLLNDADVPADSVEGDEAAYQAGLIHEKIDPEKAARWYRVAAVNDFPGASLKLAVVLAALATECRARGETHAAEALVEEASDWCIKACAAGEFVEGETEPFDLMEELNQRLGPDWRQAEPDLDSGPAADRCTRGGLAKVTRLPNRIMEEHLKSCSFCRDEKAARAARGTSTSASR